MLYTRLSQGRDWFQSICWNDENLDSSVITKQCFTGNVHSAMFDLPERLLQQFDVVKIAPASFRVRFSLTNMFACGVLFQLQCEFSLWCTLLKPITPLISLLSFFFLYLSRCLCVLHSSLFVLKASSHSESSSQSLSLQQPSQQPPPPPPPPPPQPQYGLPVPELRDKQLCFSDFEDLSASFRSLYKCVFEQSFPQQGGWRPSFCILIDVCTREKTNRKKRNLKKRNVRPRAHN